MSTEQSPLAALAEWSGSPDSAEWTRTFLMVMAACTWVIVASMATAEVTSMTQRQAVELSILWVSLPLIGVYYLIRSTPVFASAFSNTVVDEAIERWLSWAKQDPLWCGSLTGAVIAGTPFIGAMFWVILTGEAPNWFVDLMELIP